jgi:hypothetical protein
MSEFIEYIGPQPQDWFDRIPASCLGCLALRAQHAQTTVCPAEVLLIAETGFGPLDMFAAQALACNSVNPPISQKVDSAAYPRLAAARHYVAPAA